ncbi:MAG: cupin domain-containing protein [Hespellia sp.]|nr:cupin domain-containing protein [Hespellia sp.]
MTKAGEREVLKVEKCNGGAGHLLRESLLTPEQWGEHCGLFAKVTLEAGCELGYHEHHGETETYYILTGKGLYDDNGTEVAVEAGDVVYCEDGNGHGMKNAGNSDLSFVALILKK